MPLYNSCFCEGEREEHGSEAVFFLLLLTVYSRVDCVEFLWCFERRLVKIKVGWRLEGWRVAFAKK